MNANYNRVNPRFGPETRFEVKPAPPAPFRALYETELELLKNKLLLDELNEAAHPEVNVRLRRAANEAAALAWVTRIPLLVFPALFDELALKARLQVTRQARITERSAELLVA